MIADLHFCISPFALLTCYSFGDTVAYSRQESRDVANTFWGSSGELARKFNSYSEDTTVKRYDFKNGSERWVERNLLIARESI